MRAAKLRERLATILGPVLLLLAVGSYVLARLRLRSRSAELLAYRQIESNARFVPREFLGLLEKENLSDVSIADHVERTMIILFTDIRSFTPLSESMTPPQLLDFLNAYYKVLDPIISEHGGFIDAFIGDAVMALFPADPDGALGAVIAIRKELSRFTYATAQGRAHGLDTGIGLHRGLVTLGTVGTDRRMQTTAIGDTVNVASRIESATKVFGVNIIISSDLFDALAHPARFHLRSIDMVRVKGKQAVVELFEVFDADEPEVIAGKTESLPLFDEAMLHYREGDFELAIERLERCLEICPQDTIPPIYIKRCNTMLRIPPGDGWSGVSTL